MVFLLPIFGIYLYAFISTVIKSLFVNGIILS